VSLQVNNLNTVQNYPTPQMNATFKANPVATTSTLERTPTTDTLVKPTQNKTKKTLLVFGGLALAGVGLFFAAKKGQTTRVEKAFAELKKEPQKAQKTFQEVFLREDITEKEALEMVNRYESIWKIKDKKEYIEALFKEAKKNYRLDDTGIKLTFDLTAKNAENASGFYRHSDEILSITTKCSREEIMDTMHHEFRHALQYRAGESSDMYIKFRALIDSYIRDYVKKNPDCSILPDTDEERKFLKGFVEKAKKELKEKGYPKTKEMKETYEFTKELLLGKDEIFKVPEKYSEWASKCAEMHYLSKKTLPDENYKKYFEQFTEQDARFAGESIAKLFGLR